jgi:nicotinate-nucleotide adenylyltransferase
MKIAILGGTFNPLHIGHLFLAEEVRCGLGFDQIIFVPTHQPAHKAVAGLFSAADRWEMCCAALAGQPSFIVDDCEIRRGGISYMIDTLNDIEHRYAPEGKIGIIIGDDLLDAFSMWKSSDELARRARLIVVHRIRPERMAVPIAHEYFDNKLFPLSSSEIRDRLRTGRPIRYLVPDRVYEYIEARALYRF